MIKKFVVETLRYYGQPLQWPFLSFEAIAGIVRNVHHPVFRGRNIRYGDGKPLLLVPGHLAGDLTLVPLAMWLRAIGYRPTQLDVPINWDDRLLDKSLAAALPDVARRVGRKAVIIAFGTGVRTALRVAAVEQDHVSDVIALGLPDQLPPIPKGVRLHVVGRMCCSLCRVNFGSWKGRRSCYTSTQKRSRFFPRFFEKFLSRCLRVMNTRSGVDPGGRLRASILRPGNHDRDPPPRGIKLTLRRSVAPSKPSTRASRPRQLRPASVAGRATRASRRRRSAHSHE